MGTDFNFEVELPEDESTEQTQHMNQEDASVCPADGCDFTGANRSIGPHIRMSSDNAHGDKGDHPDHLTIESAESAGTESVSMEYPDEVDNERGTTYCPFCRGTFEGRAIMIHLGAMAGRENHPESPKEDFEISDFAVVETDSEDNITAVLEEGKGDPTILIDN